MNKLIIFFITILLFTTGCSLNKDDVSSSIKNNDKDVITEQPTTESLKVEKVEKSNQVKTQEDLFNSPHFVLQRFDVKIKDDKTVSYIIDYVIDSSANTYLKKHKPTLYLNILYPEEIQQSSKKSFSKSIKFTPSFDQKLNKQIIITDQFKSKFDIEKLKKPDLNFQLQVLNQNKQMFHLFDDLNVYRIY